jgi:hypothetical protein
MVPCAASPRSQALRRGTVGVPQTQIANIQRTKFERMPELRWTLDYAIALLLIVASAIVPRLWLRSRVWLWRDAWGRGGGNHGAHGGRHGQCGK